MNIVILIHENEGHPKVWGFSDDGKNVKVCFGGVRLAPQIRNPSRCVEEVRLEKQLKGYECVFDDKTVEKVDLKGLVSTVIDGLKSLKISHNCTLSDENAHRALINYARITGSKCHVGLNVSSVAPRQVQMKKDISSEKSFELIGEIPAEESIGW